MDEANVSGRTTIARGLADLVFALVDHVRQNPVEALYLGMAIAGFIRDAVDRGSAKRGAGHGSHREDA